VLPANTAVWSVSAQVPHAAERPHRQQRERVAGELGWWMLAFGGIGTVLVAYAHWIAGADRALMCEAFGTFLVAWGLLMLGSLAVRRTSLWVRRAVGWPGLLCVLAGLVLDLLGMLVA
jgi:hypothetical protein